MPNLSTELLTRLRETLSRCQEFDTDDVLRSVFVTPELSPFQNGVKHAGNITERVDLAVAYLLESNTADGRAVLPLFLLQLSANYAEGNRLRDDLRALALAVVEVTTPTLSTLPDHSITLNFANREVEMRNLHNCCESGLYVQICGPGGLGKTFLLDELQRQLKAKGYAIVSIDFANGQPYCRGDQRAVITELYRQLGGGDSTELLDDATLLRKAGNQLSTTRRAALILDNADQADPRLLEWLRREFFEALTREGNLWVLASGQRVIPEWQGHQKGRAFKTELLSGFDDPIVLEQMVDDVAARYGVAQTWLKRETQKDVWKRDVRTLATALRELSCGHPLAMERILHAALQDNRLRHPDYITRERAVLVTRCLAPIVGERILPTVDRAVREAFRSLCIFRAIRKELLCALLIEGDWAPLTDTTDNNTTGRNSINKVAENYWWLLKKMHLIGVFTRDDLMFFSPVVRQLIALVLEYEDPILFTNQHARAWKIYHRMALDEQSALLSRLACFLEAVFHAIKSDNTMVIEETLEMMNLFTSAVGWPETQTQFILWLREDYELCAMLEQSLGTDRYHQWLQIFEPLSVMGYARGMGGEL